MPEDQIDLTDLIEVDRAIHEPARAAIMAVLMGVESADFKFLIKMTQLTKGNLSVHAKKLHEAGYITIEKSFQNNYPHTEYRVTKEGKTAFRAYIKKLKWLTKAVEA
ncbi:MAG: ArsR family transcriptional regulator [Anaerolineales bacterium]|nr:ArsR family transcriptional regulator [Anaerolineales bacterium]